MQILDDTIAAIATAPGAGGLAVVRVSGARALDVADAMFRGAVSLASVPSHTVHHGWACWPVNAHPEASGVLREVLNAGRSDPLPADPSSASGQLRIQHLPQHPRRRASKGAPTNASTRCWPPCSERRAPIRARTWSSCRATG